MIAISMGDRGAITRILAPKYGGFLTFGSIAPGAESAPGQPTIAQLRDLYRLPQQAASTKVFGIIGNPVSHSKSPLLHNTAMADASFDGVYVPLLVDNMATFMSTFCELDWQGFSVTIPHKVRAQGLCVSSGLGDCKDEQGQLVPSCRCPGNGDLVAWSQDASQSLIASVA
jgi:3-dehydroquinate dehydratase / shikimate dehydrogenase